MNQPNDYQVYKRLLAYALPKWRMFALSILGFFLFSAADVLLADLMQFIIDSLGGSSVVDMGVISRLSNMIWDLNGEDRDKLRFIIPAAMMILALIRGTGFVLGNYFIKYVARHVIHQLRCRVFNHLLEAPASYYDKNTNGFLISKITFNVEQVADATTNAVKTVFREGMLVLGLLCYLIYLNWRLALVLLAVTPLIALVVRFVGKRFRHISRRIQASMGDITHVTSEAINGYREVRMFGGKDLEKQRFFDASEYNRRQYLKMALADALSPPILQMLISSALALLIWIVMQPDMLENMSAGQFVAFLAAAAMLHKPTRQLSEVYSVIQKGLAAAEDVFHVLDTPLEPKGGEYRAEKVRGEIAFENVDFAYGDGRKVLNNINFSVQPGETVALVGLSGSGKSTLVSLLSRFYLCSAGRITVDGVPIEDFDVDNLRQFIAMVSQNVTLFNTDIASNIAFGAQADASLDDIREATRLAHADEFIGRLPEGLATKVGDDGSLLSGGQRQRIALARALLKDAPILILDEATSALDNEAERHIQAAMEYVMQGRTTFVIAHRLSTVEKADRILVMEHGEIVEQGSHQQLMASDSRYKRLYERSFEE